MPATPELSRSPFQSIIALLAALTVHLAATGCSSLWRGTASESTQAEALNELMKAPDPPDLIRDATAPHGMRPIRVEGVGLINSLPGTGGPPDPSRFRDELLEEMKRHDIANPNRFLETNETALVRVQATIPPAARRGAAIDLKVIAPKVSRATDLRGGWLLDTRLRQQQMLNRMIRKSEVMAIGTGTVLTRADVAPGLDQALQLEGVVLSGGRVQQTRKLGLVLKPTYHHAKIAATLAAAINQRFFFFDGTTRRGVAKAVEDDFIELDIHPRYRENIYRFMHVVRAIGGKVEAAVNQERLAELGEKLNDPATAADAALQLEAIGENAVPTLRKGLQSENPELRFYAAESLAYLDQVEAIEHLVAAAETEPAFRHSALLAMEGLRDPGVIEALQRLTDVPSLETRYGAFCCLRRRDDGQRKLVGKAFPSFTLYAMPSAAEPTVVASLQQAAEIVLFGRVQPLRFSKPIVGRSGLMLAPTASADRVRISRFQPGQPDRRVTTGTTVAAVIKGIADVGGSYGDVISVLRLAKASGDLLDQLAIDPLPQSQRLYFRDSQEGDGPDADSEELDGGDSAEDAESELVGSGANR